MGDVMCNCDGCGESYYTIFGHPTCSAGVSYETPHMLDEKEITSMAASLLATSDQMFEEFLPEEPDAVLIRIRDRLEVASAPISQFVGEKVERRAAIIAELERRRLLRGVSTS